MCSFLACTGVDPARVEALSSVLLERANHLERSERRKIARGLALAEQRTGVDALLLLAVAEEESHFRPHAKSRRGALGLLQVRPDTGRDVAKRHGIDWEGDASLLDPSVNLLIGATYIHELRERFGSWDLALTAYNRGPTKTLRMGSGGRAPSSRYAERVLRRLETLRLSAVAPRPAEPRAGN